MAVPAGCEAIDNYLSLESGRIGPDIERTSMYTSPWLDLIEQGPWADGMGYSVVAQVVERSQPESYSDWSDINGADDCFPVLDEVPWAFTNRNYNLQTVGLRSPRLCLENLRAAHDIDEQIDARLNVLKENANIVWIERKRSEHFRLSEHKIVVAPGLPESSGASFPATEATSQLTIGVLNSGYQRAKRDSVFNNGGAMGKAQGTPVATVIADSETIQGLTKNNDDIRNDIRWSPKAEILVGPWGITHSFGNFVFMPDDTMPRYNYEAGAYHRVDYYIDEAATLGEKAEVNPAYENAEFTTTSLFFPNVYKQLNPNPNVKFGKITYGAQNYRGEFQWDNHYDLNCNPWENTGFWKARFSSASKPVQPRYGYWYIHLRCNDPLDLLVCSDGSGYQTS